MAHYLTAIIACSPVIERILDGRCLVSVELRDGLRLIPLEDDDLDTLVGAFTKTAAGFTYLWPDIIAFCAEQSVHGPLVFLETEYCCGYGSQAAVAYADGAILPPTPLSGAGAINAALRCIGVTSSSAEVDEFDYVELSRYRRTSRWKSAATA